MAHNPYIPPTAPSNPTPNTKSGKNIAVAGALLQLGPVVGTIVTLVSMAQAFDTLGTSGMGDPARLSAAIGHVLIATLIGLLIGLVGIVLLFIALLKARYRAEWFYWFLVLYGGFIILGFPVGTVIGIFLLVHCIPRREEFLRKARGGGD